MKSSDPEMTIYCRHPRGRVIWRMEPVLGVVRRVSLCIHCGRTERARLGVKGVATFDELATRAALGKHQGQ